MKNQQLKIIALKCFLCISILALSVPVFAQAKDSSSGNKSLEAVYEDLLGKYREQIKDQQKRIEDLHAQIATQQQLNQQQQAKISEMQKISESQEASGKDLRRILELQKEMQQNNESAIKDRDEVIKMLATGNRKSLLSKIIATVPSVAGIVALALAH